MPVSGEPVYQGMLTVEDHRVWIGDLDEINRYHKPSGFDGPQPITVHIDDPFDASQPHHRPTDQPTKDIFGLADHHTLTLASQIPSRMWAIPAVRGDSRTASGTAKPPDNQRAATTTADG